MLTGVGTTCKSLIGWIALAFVAGVARAQAPGFVLTGHAPGTDFSQVYALSADGRVAAGASGTTNALPAPGFTWTASGGRNDFGLEVGLPVQTIPAAISADGAFVAGRTTNRAFRYAGPGTYQEIAPVGGYTASAAQGISGDGSIVAGRLFVPQAGVSEAFRWTAQGGVQRLGVLPGDAASSANAISRDGTTIVGGSGGGSNSAAAFAWRQGTGMVGLPSLGGPDTGAWGVNFDGSVIVGQSGLNLHAVMWRDGQISDLGVPQGFVGGSVAKAVNDAGTVVVGYASTSTTQAVIWTPSSGMEFLSDYLARNGIAVPSGWTLLNATAVSADGLTIAGWGSNSSTGSEGFVVTIPAPSSILVLSAGAMLAARRRPRGA